MLHSSRACRGKRYAAVSQTVMGTLQGPETLSVAVFHRRTVLS